MTAHPLQTTHRYFKFSTCNLFWHDCKSRLNNKFKPSINRYIGKLVDQKKALSRPNDKTNPSVNGPYPTGDTLIKTQYVLIRESIYTILYNLGGSRRATQNIASLRVFQKETHRLPLTAYRSPLSDTPLPHSSSFLNSSIR
jgi:hypothetical protein